MKTKLNNIKKLLKLGITLVEVATIILSFKKNKK